MALHIDDKHILYYHMDVYRSIYPINIQLASPNIYCNSKFFPDMVVYDPFGYIIVPCHRIVAVLDVFHYLVTNTFPAS